MFSKFSYTWELMGASWNVLKRDKHLLFFPLLSGICCLFVIASFVAPAVTFGLHHRHAQTQDSRVLYYFLLFAFYFANYFVITFFNVAITSFAISRMAGGEPTFAGALREAIKHIHLIAGWALFSATVGMVLRILSERSGFIGKIVVSVLGAAWTIMAFLVVPILVIEDKGPFQALKTSMSLITKTWGERVVGNFSFGLVFFALTIPAIIAIIFGITLAASATPLLGFMIIGTAVVYIIVLSLVHSALLSIFQAAIYMYTQGVTDPQRGFPVQLLRSAMQ
ncbi:MAG TPA: DUF6159 family protein [Tepidisphaeraceae bacterium]|jgi:hypothetical protein|nr:DUF6159 family protein [Tepidisphaeraceae bacterium]